MTHETLTIHFAAEAEAERAITQLRAADAGAPEVQMEVSIDHARVDRNAIVAMLNAASGAVD